MILSPAEKIAKQRQVAELFSPRRPIAVADLFSGRYNQILKLNSAISQPGAHAIIYGERGVGKTSLANIAPITWALESKIDTAQVIAPRIACDSTDSFDSIWRKVFSDLVQTEEIRQIGILPNSTMIRVPLITLQDDVQLTPGEVLRILRDIGTKCHFVVTLDEFDRVPKGATTELVADLIKSISDSHVPVTVLLVGVGDSISQLVKGHESVGRHIVEVPLPRMSREELEKIVDDRLPKLGMTIEPAAKKFISLVCAGLPYYTHLLGQHAVCHTIEYDNTGVTKQNVDSAMKKAIEDSEREMKSAYYEATHSRQPKTYFSHTLAACALAAHDDFGYFTAASVREPLGKIRNSETDIPDFQQHLDRFCKADKGAILHLSGEKHQRRYRFRDPLMQPFIIIRSLDHKIITVDQIKAFSK